MRFRSIGAVCAAVLTLLSVSCSGPDEEKPSLTAYQSQASALASSPVLVITEIMADPSAVSDEAGEWFEVHNPGSSPVDLEGWSIASANDVSHTVGNSVVIPAGGYVVLARNGDSATNGGVIAAYSYGALNLANTSDWIALHDPDGNAVDNVAWTSRAPTGASRALINPACDNSEASGSAWKLATVPFGAGDLGTPGAVNGALEACPVPPPPLPRDVTINEVMADPSAVLDSNGEWFEVYNPGTTPIDLKGWKILSKNDPVHVIATSVVVPAKGFVVLGNNANSSTNGGVTVAYSYGGGLALANSSDWLTLSRPGQDGDVTIDSVFWNTSPSAGVSRALVKPTATNASDVAGSAWTNSTEFYGPPNATRRDRGTPGAVNPGPKSGVIVIINEPARLPVGYVKPAFPTVRDPDGTIVSPPPPLTWSSSNPAVAVVDSRGYVTGVGVGTASIKAALADGTSGSTTITIVPAQAPTDAVYRNHLEFGVPVDGTPQDEIILSRSQFVGSYNATRGGPNWVSWNVNTTHFGSSDRCNCFTPDPALPSGVYRVEDSDYRNGGYDRGHMVQSFNRTTTEQENASTYLMSNILPQAADNNQGPWSKFESYLNDLARQQLKEIYVIAGGQYAASPPTLKNEGKVAIPDYTWKVAVVLDWGEGLGNVQTIDDLQVIAVRMPNLVGVSGPASADGIRNNPWEMYETTVDAIEAATGYDILASLPDTIERIVEAKDRPPVAHIGGPYTSTEGLAVALSAAGSTDPDGDPLTFHWSFGDGSEGQGVTPSHVYADDGVYTVTVTVSDPYGATSTATATVTIDNVAPELGALPGATLLPGEGYATLGTFTDPGQDVWSVTVDYGDGSGPQPLSTSGKSFVLDHTYAAAGSYTVTVLVADDDGGTGARSVQVLVLTQQQAITDLEVLVQALVGNKSQASNGQDKGNAQSLIAKLKAARQQLDRGNTIPAVNQLEAFNNEVRAMVQSGRLAADKGQQLTGTADRIINSLI